MYLQSCTSSHTARIGLNTAWGGSIVEVSQDGINFVNAHDTGREVQPALYDGAAHYDSCAGCTGIWGWDPVLGGDRYDHGSPVIASQLSSDSIYVKAQPLEWYPDNKGGGPSTPVLSDCYFEETVSVATGAPLAFDIQFKLTHFGTDQHYNGPQEFPAMYVNAGYGSMVWYGGTKPWTNDAVTKMALPTAGTGNLYSSEEWGASVDANNQGLTVFVPGQVPYRIGSSFPGSGGSGPTGDTSFYQRPMSWFTMGPGAVMKGDVYLVPGNATNARSIVYGLHQALPTSHLSATLGNVDTPESGATITGNHVQVSGWAFDTATVSKVEVFVDGVSVGTAMYGTPRSDVATVWPNAPLGCGWTFSLDSTAIKNGAHVITVNITDSANILASFPPMPVTVTN
jgi:hypothetical protein